MLQKVKFAPGFNKQVTATGGENQWVSGDFVRFRYGTPEKIGGWAQLGDNTLTGRNTALHHFVSSAGIKYAALGTNRFLYVYSGGAFYDITPLKSTTTLTSAFTTTQSDATVTITFASAHISLSLILYAAIILALLPILILILMILTIRISWLPPYPHQQQSPLKWDQSKVDRERPHQEEYELDIFILLVQLQKLQPLVGV